jgi:hypothetical protein
VPFEETEQIHHSPICAKSMEKDLLGRAAEAVDKEKHKRGGIKRKSH